MKNDWQAKRLWGEDAYRAIPKSVFAVAAWHLSDCASEEGVGQDGEVRRFIEELEALKSSDILLASQVDPILKLLRTLETAA
jgi:hypothetical protein